jgi:uncharacterized protein YkwD
MIHSRKSTFLTRPKPVDDETSPLYWSAKIRELSGVLTEMESIKQSHLENVASAYDEEMEVIEQVIKTLTPLSASKTMSKIAQIHAEAQEHSESEQEEEVIDLTDDPVQTLQF